MDVQQQDVFFSIVIPTRNRPELFKLALDSVLAQDFDAFEIIIVNDGSTQEYLERYAAIEALAGEKVSFHRLVHRPNGHGQSYSMNYGVSKARGTYVCFLDDDDYWIDNGHLSRAYKSISESPNVIDAYYTNQDAYFADGSKKAENVWIEDLAAGLGGDSADLQGSYSMSVPMLLKSGGFAHLNCSIVRKAHYEAIGGMDENIRYECDRDIYIRTIDAAGHILYNPAVISKHNIPDTSKKDNMSTLVSFAEKLIYQLRVYDKGISFCESPELIRHCRTGKMYILKKLAVGFHERGEKMRSLFYARQALGARFSLKWFMFTCHLHLMAITKG